MPEGSAEQELEQILAAVSHGLATYDAEGHMQRVNDRARVLLGIPSELEQAGLEERMCFEQVFDEAGRLLAVEHAPVYRALHGETVRGALLLLKPQNLAPRWLRCSAFPLYGCDGRQSGAIATFDDVTHEYELEERLSATLRRSRLMFEHSLDAVFFGDADLTVETANPAACRMLGMTGEEIRAAGRAVLGELPPELETALGQRGSGLARLELVLRRKDGSPVTCEADVALFEDETGARRSLLVARDVTERERAVQATRESEERFRQLADAMPQLVWTARPDGTVDYYNRRALEYRGLERRPDGTWSWEQAVHPDDRQRTVEAWSRAWQQGADGYEASHRLQLIDGSWRWHLERAIPVRDHSGRIVRWYGTDTDIHWQKQAEHALKQSEESFRQLADAMPQLVWTARPDGTVDYYNRRAFEFRGLERRPDGTWSWEQAVHPDDRQATREAWARAVQSEGNYEVAHRIEQRGGGFRWYLSRGLAARDASGKVVRWYGTATDIDWQKRAEQELAESARRLRLLADAVPQVVWIARPDGTPDYYNERARELEGLERDGGGEWSWRQAIHPDDLRATEEAWAKALREGAPYELAHRLRVRGGWRWFLDRAVPVRGADGEVLAWYGTATDIDWQKQAELGLIDADHRKDQALAFVAHELRNPLATIRSALHVLERRLPADPSSGRAFEVVERQTRQLNRIVEDLLDLSRISQGKAHLVRERQELCELVRHAAEDYRPVFLQGGIELEVRSCSGPLHGRFDASRLAQAIGNVLDNAAKFTPRGGRVSVEVTADGAGFGVVLIEDTGAGIRPGALEKIFDQFSQGEETLDRSRKGLGLGLALVKGIVELHGGRVAAFSEGPGRGSRFVLSLPVEAGGAQPESQPPA
jgi:PAS domain S-box-containing protein